MPRYIFLILAVSMANPSFTQPGSPHPIKLLADSLLEAGQYEMAIDKYYEFIDSRGIIKDDEREPVSEAYMSTGLCYYQLDRYEDAIMAFQTAANLQKEFGDLETYANTLNNIGLCYKKLGNYEKAIEFYKQTLKLDEKGGNARDIAITYNNIGMIYRSWGKYDKAIEYINQSIQLRKTLGDKGELASAMNNMGLVYTEWKKYNEAILIFKESYSIQDSLADESETARCLNNVGRVYFLMNQYDTSLTYFEQALEISQENNDLDMIALIYNNIGKVYNIREEYPKAADYFSSALSIFSDLGMKSEKTTVMANLSNIYSNMGQHGKALQMLDSSIALAERLGLRYQLQLNYLYMSNIYGELKNFEKSLEYYKKYSSEKDSIFTKETMSQLSNFQAKYEKEKDQAQILALEKENLQKTNQRNGYLFTAIGIIIMAVFLIIYFRQRAHHIKLIASQQIRQLEEEKKMMAAKLLVEGQEEERKRIATELHDGLGVLLSATKMQFSVIHDKSPENKEVIEKATKMLEQATSDVRKISHNMMPGLLTKLGFYEAVEDLCEKIGNTQDLIVTCKISGDKQRLAENREIMMYRIVQELVNNTLKHAQARRILLEISTTRENIDIVYSDDGLGFEPDQHVISKSIGLQSIQSRVNFLNGRIELTTMPGKGVIYDIRIPV